MSVWPEPPELVEELRARIARDERGVIEEAEAFWQATRERGLTALEGGGWPLRPFVLDQRRLSRISGTLVAQLGRFAAGLARGGIAPLEVLPLPRAFLEKSRIPEAMAHPDALSFMRPDGFFTADGGFRLSEPAFGNGWIVSVAYAQLLHEYFQSARALAGLDLVEGPGPLERSIDALFARVPAGGDDPLVCLMGHAWELGVIESWPERVMQMVQFFGDRYEARGVEVVLVDETEVHLEGGVLRRKSDGRRVDQVIMLTIGISYADEPARLDEELAHLCAPAHGQTSILQPLGHVFLGKGVMPLLDALPGWTDEIRCARTRYPDEANATEIRLGREALVLKKAYDDKDTHIGVNTPQRRWSRVLDRALTTHEYIAQEYVPLPGAEMPMILEGEIHWRPVRGELSLCIFDREFAGAFSRYAPAAEGLVLSPPPDDMGFTLVVER